MLRPAHIIRLVVVGVFALAAAAPIVHAAPTLSVSKEFAATQIGVGLESNCFLVFAQDPGSKSTPIYVAKECD